ncbi:MAG TPA: type II secretion system protein GspJ [Gammaproteobacteria bacterium]|nr:type II secretion system protein GspJ [Gammaproteobacteria bacterium]
MKPLTQNGLTLLELLVAFALLAVVSVLVFSAITHTLRSREIMARQSDAWRELQHIVMVMESDFSRLVERPRRDIGGNREAAFYSQGGGEQFSLTLVVHRADTVSGRRLSNLRQVVYNYSAGVLLRGYWTHLDHFPGASAHNKQLSGNLERLELVYLGNEKHWYSQWPPVNYSGDRVRLLPRAIKARLEMPEIGYVERIFLTGVGG